jgi:D-alanine-D-alanine ligase
MLIGLTYDLRSDYLALGYSLEETAEFDKEETIAGIESALRELGYATDRVGHAKALIRRLEAGDRWDLVFNICEGLSGVAREAQVPAILDLYGVPYVFSDPLVLALTLHKGMTKRVVRDAGVPTSDFLVYETREDLAGLRFTVGVTGTGRRAGIVGAMEIVLLENAEKGVYSFDNKGHYEDRVVYRPCAAAADPVAAAAGRVALDAWRALGCRDGGRVDIRCDAAQNPMFLEVNPLAGLNPKDSDLPILARMAEVSYTGLIGRIMASAVDRLKKERSG